MTPRDILLAVAVAAVWGFAFVPIRLGVQEMPPLILTALRFFFAAVPAVFLIKPPKAPVRLVVAYGFLLGVIKFGTLFVAMKLGMPAGLSSLIMQMQVFFTLLLAAALFRERPTRLQIIAIAIAIGGVCVIAFSDARGAPLIPFLMLIFAAFVWGVTNILSKQARGANMLAFVVWSSLVSPVPLIALSALIDGPQAVVQALTAPGWRPLLAAVFLGLGATVFCFSAWTGLLNRYAAPVVTPFALLVPVFGFLSGTVFLGESIPLPVVIGGALVLLGLAINVFGPRLLRPFS